MVMRAHQMEEKGLLPELDNVLARTRTDYTFVRDIFKVWHQLQDAQQAEDPVVIMDQVTLRGGCTQKRGGGNRKEDDPDNQEKQVGFVHLVDGSTAKEIQCVFTFPDVDREGWSSVSKGATLEVTGAVTTSQGSKQPIELQVTSFKVLGPIANQADYKLAQKGFLSRDFLRGLPHQRHHTRLFLSLQIIKQLVYRSFHEAMANCDIGEVQPTLITSNECEEGANPFTVTTIIPEEGHELPLKEPSEDDKKEAIDEANGETGIDFSKDFFGKRVYLTVSSQLHLEATVLGTKRDGYCMTTAFRAEQSTGPLHLAEFCMPEWEIIGGGLERNMAVAEYSLKYCIATVLDNCSAELEVLEKYLKLEISEDKKNMPKLKKSLGAAEKKMIKKQRQDKKKSLEAKEKLLETFGLAQRLRHYLENDWNVITHEECINRIREAQEKGEVEFEKIPDLDEDFSREHELFITDQFHDRLPVFVKHYPKKVKAFYMPVVNPGDDIERVDCYDLLFPFVGEVVGGSQRIDSHEELEAMMKELGLDPESLDWYMDLRKEASLPHGGAGLGLGRLMIVLSGIHNIKDMQEFPRAWKHACHA